MCYDSNYYSLFSVALFFCFRVCSISSTFHEWVKLDTESERANAVIVRIVSLCLYMLVTFMSFYTRFLYVYATATLLPLSLCMHVNRQVPSFNHLCIYPFSSLPPPFSLSSLYFSRKQFMTWLHVAYPHTHSTLRKQSPFAILLNKPYLSVHNAYAVPCIIVLSMESLQYSNSSIYLSMTRTVALEYRKRITHDIT